MSIDIIVPSPVPDGRQFRKGEDTLDYPVCDRCKRKTSDANPILLDRRPSQILKEALMGRERCDAICVECRWALAKRGHQPLASWRTA